MKRVLSLPRWASAGMTCAAAVGLIGFTYPGGLAAAYADLRDSRDLTEQLNDFEVRREHLNGRSAVVAERIAIKESLIAGLMGGQTDLNAVAEEFRQLNAQDARTRDTLRARFGDCPEEELAVRNVLDYVESRAKQQPAPSDLMANLNRQFERRFGHRSAAH